MTLDFIIEPLADRDWLRPSGQRKPSIFKVDWRTVLRDLETELDAPNLRASDVTIHLDVPEASIRRDRTGLLKGQAPASPAVAVSFNTREHGRLTYQCDRYSSPSYWGRGTGMNDPGVAWRHNVRAISLTLEAARAMDRHGGAQGQQYGGFKALGAGSTAMPAAPPTMTEQAAVATLARFGERDADQVRREPDIGFKAARRRTHPDMGGRREDWDLVETAARVLGVL